LDSANHSGTEASLDYNDEYRKWMAIWHPQADKFNNSYNI